MKTLYRQDLLDIVQGSAVLAGGGGGEIYEANRYVDRILEIKDSLQLYSLEDISDETFVCIPLRLGCLEDPDDLVEQPGPKNLEKNLVIAIQVLERQMGQKIEGIIPSEVGPVNGMLPFYAAAAIDGALMIDADTCGRCFPELSLFAPWRLEKDQRKTPIAAATGAGETFFIEGLGDGKRATEVLKGLSIMNNNVLYMVGQAMSKKNMEPYLCPGTFSMSLEIGSELRKARLEGLDAGEMLAERCNGKVVFRGIVTDLEEGEKEGFTVGHVMITGKKEFKGHVYRVDFKNENMAGWLDDELNVTIPEIISMITKDGEVVLNHSQKVGNEVSVLVLPAPKNLLTKEGLSSFGPSYVGIDQEFKSALR